MPTFDCHVYIEGNGLPNINQNAQQVADLLSARGIDRALVMSSRAARVDPLLGNRILKSMLEATPGLYGCIVTHLNRVDASVEAVRDLLSSKRFLAVLVTSTNPDAPLQPLVADEVLIACRRYQKPVLLYTPNAACVEAALHLAKTYNMHKFVFLGMGGSDWRTGIAAAHQAVNIFLEISGSFDRAKIPAAIEAVGSHRLLFGSSLPVMDPVAVFGLLEDSGIRSNDKRRILYDNAEKLFNLEDGI